MKITNLFTVTTLTVSILAGCGGGEGDTSHVNKSSSSESGVTTSTQVDTYSHSAISQTDSKYSKTSVPKSSQFTIPNISTKTTRITEQPQLTPVMSVKDPVAPVVTYQAAPVVNKATVPVSSTTVMSSSAAKPLVQSTPILKELATPEQPTSMTVVSATVAQPSAQAIPDSKPMQQVAMNTPQMVSVEAPKPMLQSAPIFNALATPEQPTSMTVVSATVVQPTAQAIPGSIPVQQAVVSAPQMVSVEAPKLMVQSTPVFNGLATPEQTTSMTVVSATAVKPLAQTTPDSMPMQQAVESAPQMVSVDAPKPMAQSAPVLNALVTPKQPTSMTVVGATVAKPLAQTTPDSMPMQQAVVSAPQMVSVEAPKPMVQTAPVINALATQEQPTSMTVVSTTVAKLLAQVTPDSMPMQQAVVSAPQMVSVEAPKPMVQSVPVNNEWSAPTDTSLISETLDFDSPAFIIQEVPKELPSVSQPSGDIVSDFAMAQVTSEFETAVDNVNYLKDIVKSIVDQTASHSNGHGNGVQVSHMTLETGEALTIKVKHDGQSIEVTLDQSGHGHSQSAVLIGSLDYEPYTGAYTLIADFQDVSSLGISSVPSISSTIAGTYYNDNFYDIEVRNYNDQFEYGVVYIDGEGNPYMAYATHIGLDVNVEYRSQTI